MIRKPLIAVLGTVGIVSALMMFALSRTEVRRDIVAELATSSIVVEVPVDRVFQPTATGDVGFAVDIGSIDAEYLLFKVDTSDAELVSVDESLSDLPVELLLYRELDLQRSLGLVLDGATRVVLVIESRVYRPDGAPPLRAQLIALDADGSIVDSDWHIGDAEAQVEALSRALVTEGISWTDALIALIGTGRDIELGRDITSPLGERLMEALSR